MEEPISKMQYIQLSSPKNPVSYSYTATVRWLAKK